MPRLLVAAVLAAFALMAAPAQRPAPAAFSVVSIKRFVPKGPHEVCGDHSDPGMLRLINCSLLSIVERAYGLKDYQVESRGPAWVRSDLYQVIARSAAPASHAEMMTMLQAALAQQFGLRTRNEQHVEPDYVLKRASRGSTLQPALNTAHCGQASLHAGLLAADCLSARDIAAALQEIVHDRPVVNDTGLPSSGRYRVNLHFAVDGDMASDPPLFSAVIDQLGLRLEPGAMHANLLVILAAHRPSGN